MVVRKLCNSRFRELIEMMIYTTDFMVPNRLTGSLAVHPFVVEDPISNVFEHCLMLV